MKKCVWFHGVNNLAYKGEICMGRMRCVFLAEVRALNCLFLIGGCEQNIASFLCAEFCQSDGVCMIFQENLIRVSHMVREDL